jgi:hypothetical protein
MSDFNIAAAETPTRANAVLNAASGFLCGAGLGTLAGALTVVQLATGPDVVGRALQLALAAAGLSLFFLGAWLSPKRNLVCSLTLFGVRLTWDPDDPHRFGRWGGVTGFAASALGFAAWAALVEGWVSVAAL